MEKLQLTQERSEDTQAGLNGTWWDQTLLLMPARVMNQKLADKGSDSPGFGRAQSFLRDSVFVAVCSDI